MITIENAKEFITKTSDPVWIHDRNILNDKDILELMVDYAREQIKTLHIADVNNKDAFVHFLYNFVNEFTDIEISVEAIKEYLNDYIKNNESMDN